MVSQTNVSDISWNKENITKSGIYSILCVNGSFNASLCLPDIDETRPWRIALGVWTLFVIIVGILGNVFTLLAIPYAARRQR